MTGARGGGTGRSAVRLDRMLRALEAQKDMRTEMQALLRDSRDFDEFKEKMLQLGNESDEES